MRHQFVVWLLFFLYNHLCDHFRYGLNILLDLSAQRKFRFRRKKNRRKKIEEKKLEEKTIAPRAHFQLWNKA